MAERVLALGSSFSNALDLSSRQDGFARLQTVAAEWTRTSLVFAAGHVVADEEMLPFQPAAFDLIVNVLSLHAVNDLPGALLQIRRNLKPDGLFVAAMFGGETLRELREAFASAENEVGGGVSPRIAPFADVRELGALMQRAGFANPVADNERLVVRYRDFQTLVGDLRDLGETNVLQQRSRKFLRRDVLAATVARCLENRAEEDGRLAATFDIVYLTGRAPR